MRKDNKDMNTQVLDKLLSQILSLAELQKLHRTEGFHFPEKEISTLKVYVIRPEEHRYTMAEVQCSLYDIHKWMESWFSFTPLYPLGAPQGNPSITHQGWDSTFGYTY